MAISARPAADDLGTLYACDVLDGKVVAGELARAACSRHLRDLDGGSARGLSFDGAKAKRHCGFFPAVLTVTEGTAAGKPFNLLPWHGFVVASLFGWQRSDGLRRYRMAWLETGKGQAKSPLMAGIGIDMMGFASKERRDNTNYKGQHQPGIPVDAVLCSTTERLEAGFLKRVASTTLPGTAT